METAIIREARALLGVKFHHQGRSREAGVDCLGMLVLVAQACGLSFEGQAVTAHDRTDYGHHPDTAFLAASLRRFLQPVQDMRPGDVGLFLIDKRPQHLGVITDYPVAGEFGLIHAYAPLRKVVEHRLDEQWKERLAGLFRFVGH